MNPWKWLCLILLAVSVALGFGFLSAYLHSRASDKALDAYIDSEARSKGFGVGRFTEPSIPDAPAGSKPLFHAEGTVRYPPKLRAGGTGPTHNTPAGGEPTTEPAAAGPSSPQLETPPINCSLDDLDVSMHCSFDAISSPGRPYGRLFVSGRLDGYGQTRELERVSAGDVELQVAPWLNPSTWHLDILGGVAAGERFGLEFGATWTGRSRLGPYFLVEWQPTTSSSSYVSGSEAYVQTGDPATWRIHAGMRVRVR